MERTLTLRHKNVVKGSLRATGLWKDEAILDNKWVCRLISKLSMGGNGAMGFLLQVVDGICKNDSGFEELITCFLINF